MIERIISFSIRRKLVVGFFTIVLIVLGLWSMFKVPLDAVPDITNNQVQVITQAPNLATEDIEQFVTYPIEVSMANLPGVLEIRSVSRFGLSVVTIVFEEDMGTFLPRQLVSEKLVEVREEIPEGFGEISMGPIATGLGEIYQYTLQVDSAFKNKYSDSDLRTFQDWIIKRQMAMVPGVVEVNSFGGRIKQYEVAVDPDDLKAIGLTISDVFEALELNSQNAGGAYIEKNHLANFIRGEGLIRDKADIENIVIKTVNGIPIQIRNVAKVQFGSAVRYGAFTMDGEGEAVGGIVMMLTGANSNDVIQAVKERIELINNSLPEGVTIEPFLDRSALIAKTTSTVKTNLLEGALIVIFVLVFLLGNWRGGLIVASTIPLSLLFAFILMYVFDVWANLMSLGAIDFGIIVDGAVIIVEGTVFYMHKRVLSGKTISKEEKDEITEKASSKMMNSAFFGQLIILIVFLPILFLEGVEGKMFKPMAFTFMFAMLGAMILCLTYVPMISALFIKVSPERKVSWGDKFVVWIENVYEKGLKKALAKSWVVISAAIILLAVAIFSFLRIGGEFIPQLDEGDLAFHIILKPGSSLSEGIETSSKVERILLENFPEVKHAMTRFGVADVPTDPMPMDIGDCFVILKPKDEWVSADSKDELVEKMKEELSVIPGVVYEFTQPIEMRFNELLTGVREDVAIKLFGDDLTILSEKAEEIGLLIAPIQGVGDMKVEATSGLPQITIQYERDDLAQYGLNIAEVNQVLQTAFAGGVAGVVFEGERKFDLVVRLDSASRTSITDVQNLFINTPNGSQIPLQEIATIGYEPGPMQISRENTNRRTYVGVNVRDRDVKSLVEEIREKLNAELELPAGYYIRYGGAFENFERATNRLKVVVPVALVLIFLLVFIALRSLKQTIMIYMSIPLAAIGGAYALWLRDMPFSISAGVGFIVLFGVAVLNGLVLISGWNDLKENDGGDLDYRIRQGAKRRIRPILLTALTDIFGFLPMAISTSAGAEVQQPLATVVIGGMISASFLTLFVLPILYRWIESKPNKPPFSTAGLPILLLVLLCWPERTNAQTRDTLPAISLEEAVNIAVENYPGVKVAELEVKRQQALKSSTLDFGSTQIFTGGEEIDSERQGVYTPLGVQQSDIDLLGIPAKRKLANARIELAGTEMDLTIAEIKLEVRKAYSQAYIAKQRMKLLSELDSLYQQLERAARIRYEVEETSRLAFLAASTQAKRISMLKQQGEFDYKASIYKLNLWMQTDTLYDVRNPVADEWNVPVILFDSLTIHPSLAVSKQQIAVADLSIKAKKSELLPTFNAQYGIQQIDGQRGFHQYQLGITLPLLAFSKAGEIRSTIINRDIAKLEYHKQLYQLQNQYQRVLQDFLKWQAAYQFSMNEALPVAIEQRKAAIRAYREGAIDYVTLIQNLEESIEVELTFLSTLEELLSSYYSAQYILNKPF